MKKYISAILVPCLLMQFFGCYSSREISLEEFPNVQEALITTNDSSTYYLINSDISKDQLFNNPDVYFSNDWVIKPNTRMIDLSFQKAHKESRQDLENWAIEKGTANINYSDINNVSIEEVSVGKTFLYSGLTLIGIIGFFVLLGLITKGSDFGSWDSK